MARDLAFISSSRDRTIKFWHIKGSRYSFNQATQHKFHNIAHYNSLKIHFIKNQEDDSYSIITCSDGDIKLNLYRIV